MPEDPPPTRKGPPEDRKPPGTRRFLDQPAGKPGAGDAPPATGSGQGLKSSMGGSVTGSSDKGTIKRGRGGFYAAEPGGDPGRVSEKPVPSSPGTGSGAGMGARPGTMRQGKPADDNKTVDIGEKEILEATSGGKSGHSGIGGSRSTSGQKPQKMVIEARETGNPPQKPNAATKPLKLDAAPVTSKGGKSGGGADGGAGAPVADPYIGKTIGGCRLERFLGRGGMGTVYYAIQVDLERPVAFKILAPQLVSDPKQVAQFFREAKALAKVEHPNIVPIYNAAKEEEVHFLVMKLVEGGSLDGLLKKEGPKLPLERAVHFIEQAAKGLFEAHVKGITHRDIKPENMLVDNDRIMVTDFGLARMEGDSGLAFAEGRIVGTPYYMSPEQIDGRECDGRTDIYALGATFYYMLTGVRPFVADTPVEILLKHVNEELVPPIKRAPDVPEGISKIIEKMMIKDRDRRYGSLKEVLQDLAAAMKGQEVRVDVAAAKTAAAPLESKSIFEGAGSGSVKGSAVAVAPAPEVVAEKPRSFYYALGGLGAATLLALVLGATPIRELLASAAEPSPRELEAERAFAVVDGSAEHSKAGVERWRALAKEHEDTQAAAKAAAKADELEKALAKEAEDTVRAALDTAQKARAGGRHAAAIEALRAVQGIAKGTPVLEKPVESELAATIDDLAKTRHQAYVPAGPFISGENEFKKTIELGAFYVDLRETTNREWLAYVQGGGRAPSGWEDGKPVPGTEDLPVTNIPVRDAMEYARTRPAPKRLPNIYEWEKAARGTDGRKFPWGEGFELAWANQRETGPGKLESVEARPKGASPFGCLQMAGNAAEWALVPSSESTEPEAWVKGGAFGDDLVSCRAAYWLEVEPQTRAEGHPAIGIRLVQNVEQ